MGQVLAFTPRRPTLVVTLDAPGRYRLEGINRDGTRDLLDHSASLTHALNRCVETLEYGYGFVVAPPSVTGVLEALAVRVYGGF